VTHAEEKQKIRGRKSLNPLHQGDIQAIATPACRPNNTQAFQPAIEIDSIVRHKKTSYPLPLMA
jgi:hypothetical protein